MLSPKAKRKKKGEIERVTLLTVKKGKEKRGEGSLE